MEMETEQPKESPALEFEIQGEVWYWKGPAPFHFLTLDEEASRTLKDIAGLVTYGWGMIPVSARIGSTRFTTSLFYKDNRYVLPVKTNVRNAEDIKEGNLVTAHIEVTIKN